jgi:DNA-binding transcriptional MerR regulator
MNADDPSFSIEELAALTGVSRRTIRFYIQSGLVDRPVGTARSAHYTRRHLQRLLDIAAWQAEGLTLDGIRQRIEAPPEAPPARAKSALEVWTRLTLADGVELHVNAEAANLRPDDTRRLGVAIGDFLKSLKAGNVDFHE